MHYTKAEHQRLKPFDASHVGWARYIAAGVPVIDITACTDNEEYCLDVIHLILQLEPMWVDYLEALLAFGGSAWTATDTGLHRRVDSTAVSAFERASEPADIASRELREAWSNAYAREPDASDAWDHSIKAVEAILRKVISPKNNLATLGTLIRDLRDGAHKFEFVLTNGLGGVPTLIAILQLMYPNPDRHRSPDTDSRGSPSRGFTLP